MKDIDREIPEEHRAFLCTFLSTDKVPPSVVARYWRVKRCADRGGSISLDEHDLCLIAGWDDLTEADNTPPVAEFNWGEVPYGSEVTAWYRKKERPAVFQGVSPTGDCFVVFQDSPEVREIPPGKVSLVNELLV